MNVRIPTLDAYIEELHIVSPSFSDPPNGDKSVGEKGRDKQRARVGHAFAVSAEDDGIERHKMGPLELCQYKKAFRLMLAARTHARLRDEQAEIDAQRESAREAAIDGAMAALRAKGARADRNELAARLALDDESSWLPVGTGRSQGAGSEAERPNRLGAAPNALGAGALAVTLLLARMADRDPTARDALLSREGPVVLLDIPDSTALTRVLDAWKSVWLRDGAVVCRSKSGVEKCDRWSTDAVVFSATGRRKGKDEPADYIAVATLINKRIAMVGISSDARSCLPDALNAVATHRLALYPLDAETVRLVIRAVTGLPCRTKLEAEVIKKLTFDDLPLAIRAGRSPNECVEKLRGIVKRRERSKDARSLTLDELHGLDEAVAWAKASIRDLEAFKAGQIGWADIDHGVVLDGPPGTGKTTFAKIFADTAGLPLVTGTLAQWQGSGPGHLGSLLAAMRECFDEARRQAPAVLFIDEVDAFADRSKVTHDHRDYVIEVINGFLEQLDGLAGRDGLIFIAASNDVSRCDPAILRAGRLNRVIRVPLPGADDLVKMLRVRLRDDLKDVDLDEAALMAVGHTGADVERVVKDARRVARHAERPMIVDDLLRAIAGTEDARPETALRRAAVHEAGHALLCARHFGADRVSVTIRPHGRSGGRTTIRDDVPIAFETREDLEMQTCRLLAGRAAEEVILGDVSSGSGGGDDSDLARATSVAAAMASSYGLLGPTPLLYRGALTEADSVMLYPALEKAAHDFLVEIYTRTLALIRADREIVEAIADALLARRTLCGADMEKLMSATPSGDEASQTARLGAGADHAT